MFIDTDIEYPPFNSYYKKIKIKIMRKIMRKNVV